MSFNTFLYFCSKHSRSMTRSITLNPIGIKLVLLFWRRHIATYSYIDIILSHLWLCKVLNWNKFKDVFMSENFEVVYIAKKFQLHSILRKVLIFIYFHDFWSGKSFEKDYGLRAWDYVRNLFINSAYHLLFRSILLIWSSFRIIFFSEHKIHCDSSPIYSITNREC